MKKIILLYVLIAFGLIGFVYAGINMTLNLTIPVEDDIINKLNAKGFYNITYENVCDYKECETFVYVNKVNVTEKKFLGSYKFNIQGLTNQEALQKQKEEFNDYFMYRLNGKDRTKGAITLVRR